MKRFVIRKIDNMWYVQDNVHPGRPIQPRTSHGQALAAVNSTLTLERLFGIAA